MEWALFSRGINQVPLVYISFDLQDSDKCGQSRFICGWQSGPLGDRQDWLAGDLCLFHWLAQRVISSWDRQKRQLSAAGGRWEQGKNRDCFLGVLPLGKRDSVVTLRTSDVMAAAALSESTTCPSSLVHNTSATSLTHPSGQAQDRPRLVSVLQQNLGWEDLHGVYCSALAENVVISQRLGLMILQVYSSLNGSVIVLAWAGVVAVLPRMSLLQVPLPFCKSSWSCSAAGNCTWEPN